MLTQRFSRDVSTCAMYRWKWHNDNHTQHMQGAEYRWSKAGKLACIQGAMLNTLGYLTVFFPSHKLSTKSVKSHVLSLICEQLLDHWRISPLCLALNCKCPKFVDLWTGESYVSLSVAKDLAKVSTQAPINKCHPAQIKVQPGFWEHLIMLSCETPHKMLAEHLGCLNDPIWKV